MRLKHSAIFVGLFTSTLLFGRWSAIEKLDDQDIRQYLGGLSKGRSLVVDATGNKHIVYLKRDSASGEPRSWHYLNKPSTSVWDNWQNSRISRREAAQKDFPPFLHGNVITDVTGRAHVAWSNSDADTGDLGYVYYRRRNAVGVWEAVRPVTVSLRAPANITIGGNSDGGRIIIVYSDIESSYRVLRGVVTINNGATWSPLGVIATSFAESDFPSVAVDEAGYFYITYLDKSNGKLYCDLRDNTTFASIWKYEIGGTIAQCCEDPVDGSIHFANIKDGNVIYRYRVSGDGNITHWYGIDTLIDSSLSQQVSISCYNSTVGVLSGMNVDRDTLYFEQKNYSGVWNTTALPRWAGHAYAGRCVAIDANGYAHIDGNVEVSGANALMSDSIFYFTNKVTACVDITPERLGGWTYPGVSVSYLHNIENCGNIIDSFGIYIANAPAAGKIDSVKLNYLGGAWVRYPDTLWINDMLPGDSKAVRLWIYPSDTCPVCYKDSVKFIGFSKYNPAIRDSATDTIRIRINIGLSKIALNPPTSTTLSPGDTITYRIVLADTWGAGIDSLTIYDAISKEFSSSWVDSLTRPSNNTYSFITGPPKILVWTIRNLPGKSADTLFLKGVVKQYGCSDTVPANIINLAYTPGTECISADTSGIVSHNIAAVTTTLNLKKSADHVQFDTLAPRDTITYYLKLKNTGKFYTKNAEIIDTLDDDVASVIDISPADSNSPTRRIRWKQDCLPAGDSMCCTLTVVIGRNFKMHIQRLDTLYDFAIARGQQVSATVYSDTTIHYILRTLDVFANKYANPVTRSTVLPGDSIRYRLVFRNDGTANSIMRNIGIVDTLDSVRIVSVRGDTPISLTPYPVLSWLKDSLAPGDSFVATYWGKINNAATLGDSVRNWFRVIYPPEINYTSSEDTTVHYIGAEDIIKTAVPVSGSWVNVKDTIVYTITYFNRTPNTINNVIIKDTIDFAHLDTISISGPTHTIDSLSASKRVINWNIGNIAAKDSFAVWCSTKVWAGSAGNIIPNIATFDGLDSTPDTGKTEHHIMAVPRLTKTSTPANGSIVNPGQTISYTLVARNYSITTPAKNLVIKDTVTNVINAQITYYDTLKDSAKWTNVSGNTWVLTWWVDSIGANSIDSCKYNVIASSAVGDSTAGDTVFNWASLRDSISNKTVHPIRIWKLRMDKNAYAPYPDSSVVIPGDIIHYYITIANNGGATAHGVIVRDTIDTTLISTVANINAGGIHSPNSIITWTLGNLTPGYSITLTYDGRVSDTVKQGTIINRCAETTTDAPGDMIKDSTFHFIVPKKFSKWAIPASGSYVKPGDVIQFRLSCTAGASDTEITIVDTLSPLLAFPPFNFIGDSFKIDSISAPAKRFFITWRLKMSAGTTDTVGFSATVQDSNNFEGNTIFNYGTFYSLKDTIKSDTTIHTIGLPHINILKTAVPASGSYVTAGDSIVYTLRCENTGMVTGKNITVKDTLSNYFSPSGVVIWGIDSLTPGQDTVYTFTKFIRNPLDDTAYGDTIWNKSWLTSTDEDVPNTSDTTYHILARPTINIYKKKSFRYPSNSLLPEYSIVAPGDTFEYEITFKSLGPVKAKNVWVIDTIKSGRSCVIIDTTIINPDSATVSYWKNSSLAQNVIQWKITEMDSGEIDTARFRVRVNNLITKQEITDTIDTLKNTYWITGDNIVSDTSDTHILYVAGKLDLEINKWAIPVTASEVSPGDTISYFISYNNTGNTRGENVQLTDTLWGANYRIIPPISNGGIASNGKVIWSLGNVAPNYGDTVTFRTIVGNLKHQADTLYDSAYIYGSIGNISKIWTSTKVEHYILNTDMRVEKTSNRTDTVIPGDTITYTIKVTNLGQATLRQVILRDTIWGDYRQPLIGHMPEWRFPSILPSRDTTVSYRAVVKTLADYGLGKNIVDTTLGTINNRCVVFASNSDDTVRDSTSHIVVMKYGVEIAPDNVSLDSVFVNESKVCVLTVKNTGDFTDSIKVTGYNLTSGWRVTFQGTTDSSYIFPDVPPDSTRLLTARIYAPPLPLTCDTTVVIANSIKVKRINKQVADTSIIFRCSRERVISILVDPDDTGKTSGTPINYTLQVINNGNDYDTVDITVDKVNNGWTYALTHTNGTPLTDSDGDNLVDVGVVPPYGTSIPLRLTVTPPPSIMIGATTTLADTILVWGTSSINTSVKDSARVITLIAPPELSDSSIHNYPNPFRRDEGTNFVFVLPRDTYCTLIILNRKGELIKSLFENQLFTIGKHEVLWDGTNQAGRTVAAGTYIYMFKLEGRNITKKLTLLPERR
ncbi:MAG: hypothetical protein PHE49_00735 [bacterium]|nr:hypothetical protein [bacterium]